MQPSLFDWQNRFEKLKRNGDQLVKLNKVIEWNNFRPVLETLRAREKKGMGEQSP
jgi:IS5 family transposase